MDWMPKKDYDIAEITRILLEMRDNCMNGMQYDDPKRWAKFDALSDGIDLINRPMRMDGRESLNTLRDAIYADAVAHGLWEDHYDHFKSREALTTFGVDVNDLRRFDCGYLVNDESFELIEASNNAEAFTEELADVIIMSLSVAGKLGIDIDAAVRGKMEINKGRAWKHGKE